MLLIILLLLIVLFLCSNHVYNNTLFLSSLNKGMELTEEQGVVHDKMKYKDEDKPVYYDFLPDVKPMS